MGFFSAVLGLALPFLGARKSQRAQVASDNRNIAAQSNLNAENIAEARCAEAANRRYFLEDREYSSPVNVRARLEAAGLNPLTGADSSAGLAQGNAAVVPVLGRHVTRSFTGWGQAFDKAGDILLQQTALKKENQRLQEQVQNVTLRQRVPGIYGQRRGTSRASASREDVAVAQDVGSTSGVGLSGDLGAGFGADSIGSTRSVAPGRTLEEAPYSSGPGLTEISNRFGTLVVPGADGEPWGIDEVATVVAAGVAQAPYRFGKALGNWRDNRRFNNAISSGAAIVRQRDKDRRDYKTYQKHRYKRGVNHAQ